jgi:hypothetical protein
MSILDVVARARNEPPYVDPESISPDSRLVCKVLDPIPWNRQELEHELGIEIPPELATLWDSCGGLILYEDAQYRQWGLIVMSPAKAIVANRRYRTEDERMVAGDLIFAEFWGDLELAMIRNDRASPDYGSVMIVGEMDPRSYWYTAARTLEEFLTRFMDAHGEKYWEYHYQKRQADQAKQLK